VVGEGGSSRDSRGEKLLLEYTYNNRKIRLLIDTAAQASLIWKRIGGLKNIREPTCRLQGLGGVYIKNYGTKTLILTLPDKTLKGEVQITENLSDFYDGILGLDFMLAIGAVVDVGKQELRVGGGSYPLILQHNLQEGTDDYASRVANLRVSPRVSASLRLKKTVFIKNRTEKIEFIKIPRGCKEATYYVVDPEEDRKVLQESNIYIARSLVQRIQHGGSYYVPVSIANVGQSDVTLKSGVRVAQLSAVRFNDLHDVIVNNEIGEKEILQISQLAETTGEEEYKEVHDKQEASDEARAREQEEKYLEDEEEQITDEEEIKRILEDKIQHVPEEDDKRANLRQLLYEYIDLFMPPRGEFPKTTKMEHTIVTNEKRPVFQQQGRIAHHLQPVVEEMIEDQLKKKIIRETTSPWNSRIVMVKKRAQDGNKVVFRACIDMRAVNQVTEAYYWEIPHIAQSLDYLKQGVIFSTLDVTSSYYLVPISEECQDKTAFSFKGKQYCYVRLPMGAKNSANVFQSFIDSVIRDVSPHMALTYIDDTIVHGQNFAHKLRNLREVFSRFRDANISLNVKKCEFCKEEVEYLGFIVSSMGVKPTPRLVEKVKNAKQPVTKTDVRAFLSLANFYRKFVKDFAEIAKPLNQLVVKGAKENVEWSEECQFAFDTLKEKLITAPILRYPDFSKIFTIDCDASQFACGVVLTQLGDDGNEYVVGYASKKFSPSEVRYSATERELAGVVFGVRHFKHYLLGAPKFRIRTDHKCLEYLANMKTENSRLTKWSLEMEMYNYEIIHRPGRLHGNCDGMSRLICAVDIITSTELQQEQQKDEFCIENKDKDGFIVKEGLLCKRRDKEDIVVAPKSLVKLILTQLHIPQFAAHRGVKPLLKAVAEKFWWKGRREDVKKFVRGCIECEKRSKRGELRPPLQEYEECTRPWQTISIDITLLPKSIEGYTCILTIIDFFSRYLIMVPLEDQKSSSVAAALVKEVYLKMGCPSVCLSDNAKNFKSKLMEDLAKLLDIKRQFVSVYAAFSNGRIEIAHKSIKKKLSYYVEHNQERWATVLPYIVSAYNNTVHSSTNKTPHEIVFGLPMKSPFEAALVAGTVNNEQVLHLKEMLADIWSEVTTDNHAAFKKYKVQHDKKVKVQDIRVGSYVLMKNIINKKGVSRKLSAKWTGPYKVLAIISDTNIKIFKVNRELVVHLKNIKLYNGVLPDENSVLQLPADVPDAKEEEVVLPVVQGDQQPRRRGRPKIKVQPQRTVRPVNYKYNLRQRL
jgi:hypothetical protein